MNQQAILTGDLRILRFGFGSGRILVSKGDLDPDTAESKILDLVYHIKLFKLYSITCHKFNEMENCLKKILKLKLNRT